ncbi:MAG: hypothetical protein U0Z53_27330 [Blastocatellia bacterium]
MNCQNIRAAIDASSPREPFSGNVTTHLAACQNCGDYAAQMTALLTLMNDVPRVEVPNDFDFRLRARLAQAKAAQAPRGGLSFFNEFWKLSFSWGQAASAMAAVALVVTLSTFWLTSRNQSAPDQPTTVAVVTPAAPEQTPPAVAPPTVTPDKPAFSQPKPVVRESRVQLASAVHPKEVKTAEKPAPWPGRPPVQDEETPVHQILVRSSKGFQRAVVHEVSFGGQPVVVAVDSTPRPVQAVF